MSSKKDESSKESSKKRKAESESKDNDKDKEKDKTVEKASTKEKEKSKKEDAQRRKETHNSDEENEKDPKEKSTSEKPSPFDSGLEPDKIIGATDINGALAFLVQWKNSNKAMLIPSKLARQKCPQLVIDFYEQRLAWHTE